MAYRVLFTESAEGDRDRIVAYLVDRLGNPQAARHFLSQLDAVVDCLESMPLGYPACSEGRLAAGGWRKARLQEMSYVAIFRVEGDRVVVGRIFHTRQNYARLL